MIRLALVVSVVVWFSLAPYPLSKPVSALTLAAQDPATIPATIPADTKNPVKASAESRAKAKKMYGYDCEMCHAANGDGKTDLAKDMGMTLTDLSDPKTLAAKSDADLFNLFRNGKDKMPAEDAARAKPDDIWNLVTYVRSLAKN